MTAITPTIPLDAPGKHHGFLRLPYSRNDSAWGSVMIPLTVIRGGDGPTALLTGGNHGDEYEGPLALQQLAWELEPAQVMGRVIILPAMNAPAVAAGTRVSYVKPHGALYNTIAEDARQADAVIAGVMAVDPSLVLMGLAGAPVLRRARAAGLPVVAEAFADRAYTAAGALVSRRQPGAVLHDPDLIAARMLRLATEGVLEAEDGSILRLEADSICVHGDSPGAVAIAAKVRDALVAGGVAIAPFAGGGA